MMERISLRSNVSCSKRIHDLARKGDIVCPCGCEELTVDIRGSSIVLECEHCGSFCVLRAKNAGDLERLRFGVGLRAHG